jgi:phage terminase large subunit-like protein
MEGFQAEGYPVVEFSQQSAGMVQATSGFQQAVIDEGLTHDGDPTLMLHVRNCHVELAKGGIKVQKASKMSTAKIDSAVAGIMARYRAVFYADRPEPVRGVFIG